MPLAIASSDPAEDPSSPLRSTILYCVSRFRAALGLAELAAGGAEPLDGAEHLVGTISDLRAELTALRRALRR